MAATGGGAATSATSDTLVMFGATGDLAHKKLFPALWRLHRRGVLGMPVVGVALEDWTDDQLRDRARSSIVEAGEAFDEDDFATFAAGLRYVSGNYAEADTFQRVATAVGTAKHPLFHLAIPPSMFETVADGLAGVGLHRGSRLVIEKPFGRDLASAIELNAALHRHFDEEAIFRIDHFLGKEALRSLLISRFANAILEPIWHRHYVDAVMITMAESFDVVDRGSFYDSVGALRDIPGLVLACPARGDDAARMLRGAIAIARACRRVVVFLEPIALYHERDLYEDGDGLWLSDYPAPGDDAASVLLPGQVGVYHRERSQCLIVSYANGLRLSLRAARRLLGEGVQARVLDVRWLAPLPMDAIELHARQCGRVFVADECRATGGGIADAVIAGLVERGFRGELGSARAADSYVPLGAAAACVLVSEDDIVAGVRRLGP